LGVGLSPTGNFKNAKQDNAEKATRALYKSKKDSRSFKFNAKRNNYKSAPCLSPLLHGKKSELQ
jgi:hypothetical protein